MNFEISKVYNFNTLSPTFLGASIKRARFKGMLDYKTARRFTSIDQLHVQIYPTLPTGSPRSPESSLYYLFESESGNEVILSGSWIDESSIEVVENVDITVKIVRASLEDVNKVRIALSAAGISDFVISTN